MAVLIKWQDLHAAEEQEQAYHLSESRKLETAVPEQTKNLHDI